MKTGRHVVDVGDVVLSVEVRGQGPPLLFTTPGWGFSIHGYVDLRPLEERFTVIWTETRGTGESTAPANGDYRLSSFTADAEALRVALGLDRWWIAGHSFGGVLAQDYVTEHAGCCLGALLLCTFDPHDPTGPDDTRSRAEARAGDPGCDDALVALAESVTTDEEATARLGRMLPLYFRTLEAAERYRAMSTGVNCRVAARVAMDLRSIDRRPTERLLDIDVPTVVVAGSDDFICSPPKNQRLHHLIGGSKFVLVERAGHFPWSEAPDQFWAGLDHALDGLSATS